MLLKRLNVFVVFVIFFISFASASFTGGDLSHSIETQYLPDDSIKGWINISLSDADFNSFFTTSDGDSITLIDLLKLNHLSSICDIPNCQIDYNVSEEESLKEITLNKGETQIVGFKFDKDMTDIISIDFEIFSDVGEDCDNQLKIDLFNDNSIDIKNTDPSDPIKNCILSGTKGCFDESKSSGQVLLDSIKDHNCQRMELPESKGFNLGANLIAGTEDLNGDLNMFMYHINGTFIEGCTINDLEINGISGEYFCDIEYQSSKTAEYYICIMAKDAASTHKINYYQDDQDGCGFFGTPPVLEEDFSYDLIAYSIKFGAFEGFSINEKSTNFVEDVRNYLTKKYGGYECSVNNCVVPLKFFSYKYQNITLKNLNFKYNFGGGSDDPTNQNFYNLSEIPLKYNSGFNQIFLDEANFKISKKYGNDTFWIKFNDEEIFSQEISILSSPIIRSLNPLITAAAVETEFKVNLETPDPDLTIVKYKWDFGDGNSIDTTENIVKYAYSSIGKFNITLEIIDSNQVKTSKIFEINVETPKDAVDITLKEKLDALDKIKSQTSLFSEFHKNSLQPILNLIDAENQLTSIKTRFDTAPPNAGSNYYIVLIEKLIALNLPKTISINQEASNIPFYFKEDKIDLNALSLLDGELLSGKDQEYNDAIFIWNHKYLKNTINYNQFSADYGDGFEVILSTFELNLNWEESFSERVYLVFKKLDSIKFENDYNKREEGDYVFIPLTDQTQKISFSTTEDFDFSELPLFISPEIDKLQVFEEVGEKKELPLRWIFMGLSLFLLIIVSIIVYLIMHRWYKNKYESYLFKNKNDLYNLISFIENAKKKGTPQKDIVSKLKKSGWNSEQMRYITRKYIGKRTGMFEFPIEKILNLFKKKQTIPPKANIQKRALPPMQGVNPRGNIKRFKR